MFHQEEMSKKISSQPGNNSDHLRVTVADIAYEIDKIGIVQQSSCSHTM